MRVADAAQDVEKQFAQVLVPRRMLGQYQRDGWDLAGKEDQGGMVFVRRALPVCSCVSIKEGDN